MLPPVAVGLVLLWLLGRRGPVGPLWEALGVDLVFTWWAAALAAAVVGFPLLTRACEQAFADVDPRYATWELETPDGQIVTGLKIADGNSIELLQADGRKLSFPRDQIESLRMIRQSAMPDDVAGKLTRRELRDLVAFLAALGKPAP